MVNVCVFLAKRILFKKLKYYIVREIKIRLKINMANSFLEKGFVMDNFKSYLLHDFHMVLFYFILF